MANRLKNEAIEARQRSQAYGFFASIFGEEPTKAVLNELNQPPLSKILSNAGAGYENLLDQDENEIIEALAIEFSRLFIGPGKHIPPYSSAHMETQPVLWGETTKWAVSFFKAVGFKPHPNRSNPPDHIANELELLQNLTAAEEEAVLKNDREGVCSFRALQYKFYQAHFSEWGPRFFDVVSKKSGNSFLQGFCRAGEAVC
ncbi:MAG: TorD/DmsD family molecular chaperone [Alphaproteobacteria bacterium]